MLSQLCKEEFEEEQLMFPEYLSSPPFFNGVHVTRSLAFCV
jgi:hypothetical protein